MLVLSRQRNESIVIGDQVITITVVDIRGDKVRLGIDAPKDIPVHRMEVYHAIQREGERRNGGKKEHQSAAAGSVTDNDVAEVVSGGHAEENPPAEERVVSTDSD